MDILYKIFGIIAAIVLAPIVLPLVFIHNFTRDNEGLPKVTDDIPTKNILDDPKYNTILSEKQWNIPTIDKDYIDYNDYVQSDEWHQSFPRMLTLTLDDNKCRMCGDDYKLEVHHITYENLGKELAADLVTLCHDCHTYTHKIAGKGAKTYPPLNSKGLTWKKYYYYY